MPQERHALICNDFNNLPVGKFLKGNTCRHQPGGTFMVRHSHIHLTLLFCGLYFQLMCFRFFFSGLLVCTFQTEKHLLVLNQIPDPFGFTHFFSISSLFIFFLHNSTIDNFMSLSLSSAVPFTSCKMSFQEDDRH